MEAKGWVPVSTNPASRLTPSPFNPPGIILSGSPYSVYDADAPQVDPAVFTAGVPVLGICFGLQEIARVHKGKVEPHDRREYGFARVTVERTGNNGADALFEGIEVEEEGMQVGPARKRGAWALCTY